MKTSVNFDHVDPKFREHLLLNDRERISKIYRDCWVNYPQVVAIRAGVRAIYEMPPKTQAQCMLICGRPGMGKTSLFKKIESDMESLRKRHIDSYGCIAFSLSPDPNLRKRPAKSPCALVSPSERIAVSHAERFSCITLSTLINQCETITG